MKKIEQKIIQIKANFLCNKNDKRYVKILCKDLLDFIGELDVVDYASEIEELETLYKQMRIVAGWKNEKE